MPHGSFQPVPGPAPLRRLERDERASATELLATAFLKDPFYRFVLPEPRRLETWLRGLMGAALGLVWPHAYGACDEAAEPGGDGAGRLLGVLCLTPPGRWPPGAAREGLALARALPRLLAARPTLRTVVASLRTHALIERLRPRQPHWYLCLAAVRPEAQGRGVGRRLVEGALAVAAGDPRAPLYLETTNAANVPFYRRFGFEVVAERLTPGGGPSLWTMLRPV